MILTLFIWCVIMPFTVRVLDFADNIKNLMMQKIIIGIYSLIMLGSIFVVFTMIYLH